MLCGEVAESFGDRVDGRLAGGDVDHEVVDIIEVEELDWVAHSPSGLSMISFYTFHSTGSSSAHLTDHSGARGDEYSGDDDHGDHDDRLDQQ